MYDVVTSITPYLMFVKYFLICYNKFVIYIQERNLYVMQYYSNLARIRRERGYTQADIAKALGTTQQTINRYEQGQVEMSVQRFIELANFYGITLDELAGRSPSKNSDTDTKT